MEQTHSSSQGNEEDLTESEKKGMEKLRKCTDNKDLVVIGTDKSGIFATVEWSVYMQMDAQHVGNDKFASLDEVTEARNNVAGHLR